MLWVGGRPRLPGTGGQNRYDLESARHLADVPEVRAGIVFARKAEPLHAGRPVLPHVRDPANQPAGENQECRVDAPDDEHDKTCQCQCDRDRINERCASELP
jgi:hypothetical protein